MSAGYRSRALPGVTGEATECPAAGCRSLHLRSAGAQTPRAEGGISSRGSGRSPGYEAVGTSSLAWPSMVSLCPHSHWKTARLERHSSSAPKRTNFSRHLSQISTICSAERCMRASSSLGGSRLYLWRAAWLRADANFTHPRDGYKTTALYLRVLMLDAKLPNRFSVTRRKLELRFKFIEGYEFAW